MSRIVSNTDIRKLIPHSGNMCLLDKVIHWDQTQIECLAISHKDEHNPLKSQGQLLAIHLIEYGAQAIAVHGGLLAKSQNKAFRPGYLAGIHEANFYIDTVDCNISELFINACAQLQSDAGVIYTVQIHTADHKEILVKARVTVMLIPYGMNNHK